MRVRTAILWAWLLIVHAGYKPLSQLLDDSEWQRASNVYFALHGLSDVAGCGLLLFLRPRKRLIGWLWRAACWFGIFMGLQVEVCGAVWIHPLGYDPALPQAVGLCIAQYGERVYIAAGFASLAVLLRESWTWFNSKRRVNG